MAPPKPITIRDAVNRLTVKGCKCLYLTKGEEIIAKLTSYDKKDIKIESYVEEEIKTRTLTSVSFSKFMINEPNINILDHREMTKFLDNLDTKYGSK